MENAPAKKKHGNNETLIHSAENYRFMLLFVFPLLKMYDRRERKLSLIEFSDDVNAG